MKFQASTPERIALKGLRECSDNNGGHVDLPELKEFVKLIAAKGGAGQHGQGHETLVDRLAADLSYLQHEGLVLQEQQGKEPRYTLTKLGRALSNLIVWPESIEAAVGAYKWPVHH